MATFTITGDGTTAGQALGAESVSLFVGGTLDTAKIVIEASPDNVTYAPVISTSELSGFSKGIGGIGVASLALPSGWFVRTRTVSASSATNTKVVIA